MSASSDIPDKGTQSCSTRTTTPCLILFLVLRLQATAVGHCPFLRYKEDGFSGWLSIFLLFLPARSSLGPVLSFFFSPRVLVIFLTFSLCFIAMLSKVLLVSLFAAVAVAAPAQSMHDRRSKPDVPCPSRSWYSCSSRSGS